MPLVSSGLPWNTPSAFLLSSAVHVPRSGLQSKAVSLLGDAAEAKAQQRWLAGEIAVAPRGMDHGLTCPDLCQSREDHLREL